MSLGFSMSVSHTLHTARWWEVDGHSDLTLLQEAWPPEALLIKFPWLSLKFKYQPKARKQLILIWFSMETTLNKLEGKSFEGASLSILPVSKRKKRKKERKENYCELILWWEPILINRTEEAFWHRATSLLVECVQCSANSIILLTYFKS